VKSKLQDTRQPPLGFGLGLRVPHYDTIIAESPAVDWFEVLSENYFVPGGKPLDYLERIRRDYPVVMHGVSMSIGAHGKLNREYLKELKTLADRIQPRWISDHLCWTGVDGYNLHDLMPLPYTEEALAHVVDHVREVQDFLGRRFVLENVSSYLTYRQSDMSEWDFLREIAERADCHILLDVNNIYVSSFNHGFDAMEYLNGIPANRVQQFHLAGHQNNGDCIIDTHDAPVVDDNIPPLAELLAELEHCRSIATPLLAEQAAA
jgi:uncharacterized protein (UPF0276 family)